MYGKQYRKEAMNQSTKLIQKLKQRNYQKRQLCYRKVGRAITKWGAIEERLMKNLNLSNKPL